MELISRARLRNDTLVSQMIQERGLSPETKPRVEERICRFLRLHGVFIESPSRDASYCHACSRTTSSRCFADKGRNQRLLGGSEISGLIDWETWKKIALTHKEWPAFRRALARSVLANKAKVNSFLGSVEFAREYLRRIALDTWTK